MVFVLVLFGLVIGVYLLLTVALLFVGLYGVFGAVIYGPLLLINYLQWVFEEETASEVSHDIHKVNKRLTDSKSHDIYKVNKRLTDSKSHNKVGSRVVTSYEVEAPGIIINSSTASSSSIYPDMV